MEAIYSKAFGIDVHKTFIFTVICDSTFITTKYLRNLFSAFNNTLNKFRNWLNENDYQNVSM